MCIDFLRFYKLWMKRATYVSGNFVQSDKIVLLFAFFPMIPFMNLVFPSVLKIGLSCTLIDSRYIHNEITLKKAMNGMDRILCATNSAM